MKTLKVLLFQLLMTAPSYGLVVYSQNDPVLSSFWLGSGDRFDTTNSNVTAYIGRYTAAPDIDRVILSYGPSVDFASSGSWSLYNVHNVYTYATLQPLSVPYDADFAVVRISGMIRALTPSATDHAMFFQLKPVGEDLNRFVLNNNTSIRTRSLNEDKSFSLKLSYSPELGTDYQLGALFGVVGPGATVGPVAVAFTNFKVEFLTAADLTAEAIPEPAPLCGLLFGLAALGLFYSIRTKRG